MRELELSELTTDEFQARMTDAVVLASGQDDGTWLSDQGKHVAAVVPVEVAEAHERLTADVLARVRGCPAEATRYMDVKVKRSALRDGDTSTLLNVVLGAMRARGVCLADLRRFRQAVFDAGSYAAALALAEQTVSFE